MSMRKKFAKKSERIVHSTKSFQLPDVVSESDVEVEKVSYDEAMEMANNGEFDQYEMVDGYDPETKRAIGGIVGYIFE